MKTEKFYDTESLINGKVDLVLIKQDQSYE